VSSEFAADGAADFSVDIPIRDLQPGTYRLTVTGTALDRPAFVPICREAVFSVSR